MKLKTKLTALCAALLLAVAVSLTAGVGPCSRGEMG